MKIKEIKPGTYLVAVSGGVDSVVLLDYLAKKYKDNKDYKLIVAHYDHGIRADSEKDAKFVQKLAQKYKLEFVSGRGELGPNSSEAEARSARYGFFEEQLIKQQADAVITAHHHDDVLETAIINLVRGTGRKGLSSLKDRERYIRPMLGVDKQEILNYAKENELSWREDPSNLNEEYLRNYIRKRIMPVLAETNANKRKFSRIITSTKKLNQQADLALELLVSKYLVKINGTYVMPRSWFVGLPGDVAQELIAHILRKSCLSAGTSRKNIKQAWLFAKTAKSKKSRTFAGGWTVSVDDGQIYLKTK